MYRKFLSIVIMLCLVFQQTGLAQAAAVELNFAGHLARISGGFTPDMFRPVHIRFFSYDALSDNFKIMLDKGDIKEFKKGQLEQSTQELMNYFLIGLTLPNDAFWVNLRPDAEDKIIDRLLAATDIGKIMLEADLQLKKDTSRFTSPETPEGRLYWNKLYKKAEELYGYDQVAIPTVTRPWIVPNEIIVRETKDSAYIYKATLKVMLEQDYLKDSRLYNFKDGRAKVLNEYSAQLMRELILPKITKEINISQRYAPLRQAYYSIILSRWFKMRFSGKSGKYPSLIDKSDLTNLTSKTPWSKATYFQQYKKSFAEGEYNTKEVVQTPTGQVIRTYISGGIGLTGPEVAVSGAQISGIPGTRTPDVLRRSGLIDPDQPSNTNPSVKKPIEESQGATKVAINNPGAQERELIRQWLLGKTTGIELVGVNGVSPTNLFYLLTKDFSATPDFRDWFNANFKALPEGLGDKDGKLVLPVTEIIETKDLPWKTLNAEVVIEGKDSRLADSHTSQGAQSVIVTHPALTAVTALIPILSVLPTEMIQSVSFRDIQPPSSLQRGLDNSGTDPVLMRAMAPNVSPALSKDITSYLLKLLPASLAKLITGKIEFAPQALGSLLDIHIVAKQDTDVARINQLFKEAAEGVLKGRILYSQDPALVSVDTFQQSPFVFAANSTKVTGTDKKIIHLQVWHHEDTTFAASQIPLLLEALRGGKVPAVITSKDSQTIAQDAEEVLTAVQTAQSRIGRPKFLDDNSNYIPSRDATIRPRILPTGEAAIVGVNGPGRTGRTVVWAMQGDPNIDLRMINGSSSALTLAWLLAEDSVQQSTTMPVTRIVVTPEELKKEILPLLDNYTVEHVIGLLTGLIASQRLFVMEKESEFIPYLKQILTFWGKPEDQLGPAVNWLLKSLVGVLDLNGKKVLIVNERKAVSELPWDAAGIKTILECTGDLKNAEEASQHLRHIKGGRVIISAPAEGAGQSIVLGVVDPTRAANIVDNASCTTNCLMPVVSVLDRAFGGIITQEMTTVHAYTTDQKFATQEPHKKEATRGRDARTSAVPGSTGAAKTAAIIYPHLSGKSDGTAVRTANLTGSVVALTAIVNGKVTKEQVQQALRNASQNELAGILAYTQTPIVSTTVIGNPASSIADGNSIETIYDDETDQTTISLEAWYDNETGFSHRMVNLAVYYQGFSLIEGRVIADIGPQSIALFKDKLKQIAPRTIVWNGPMGVSEIESTSHGTAGIAQAITESGDDVIKVAGGGDTLKSLPEETRAKFTHVSTGGGAFLEAFQFGVENLPGIKALIDPSTSQFAELDALLAKLKEGDRVLVRMDFNVPLDSQLNVVDNTRIRESLATIKALLEKKVKLILMSHLGRPNGKYDPKLKMDPVAEELRKLLPEVTVYKVDDCVGKPVEDFIQKTLKTGEILILENTRFRLDEEQNIAAFARQLSRLGDYYVNDAFAVNHRAHASNVGVTQFFEVGKKFSGRLLEREYQYLKEVRQNPQEPLVVILGGAKVSDKIHIINALKGRAAAFLIGGRMAIAFLVAQGKSVGDSTPDKLDVQTAERLLADPELKGKIILPVDGIVVTDVSTGRDATAVEGEVKPSDMSVFKDQFLKYLQSYVPLISAEGKALASLTAQFVATVAETSNSPTNNPGSATNPGFTSLSSLNLEARVAKDSRNKDTVEVTLRVGDLEVIGVVPAGASKGRDEAPTVDIKQAIANVAKIQTSINETGLNLGQHVHLLIIDSLLNNVAELGANATVPVSWALWKMAAKLQGLELYEYIRKYAPESVADKDTPVLFFMNIFNGGLHALKPGEGLGQDRIDIQEIMVVPVGATTYAQALAMGDAIDYQLKQLLRSQFTDSQITRADESGFSVKGLGDSSAAIALVFEAIKKAGYTPGKDVKLALDVAASSFFKDGKYYFRGKEITSRQMIDYYMGLVSQYPGMIISIEDGLDEDDWEGWQLLTREMQKLGIRTIGDDNFVTQLERLRKGISMQAATDILIKVNQNGTVSGTLEVIKEAKKNKMGWVISHRSGETLDDSIADLAYATNAFGLKSGDPQPDYDFIAPGADYTDQWLVRRVKYSRMAEIEEREDWKDGPPKPANVGGIDFRNKALKITYQPMGNFVGLEMKLPTLSKAQIEQFNIEGEISRLEKMVDNGILPSGQGIKEILAACVQKGELDNLRERITVLLVKMGILEERQWCLKECSKEYKEALVLVDSLTI